MNVREVYDTPIGRIVRYVLLLALCAYCFKVQVKGITSTLAEGVPPTLGRTGLALLLLVCNAAGIHLWLVHARNIAQALRVAIREVRDARGRVIRVPGVNLQAMAMFVYSHNTYDRVFEQLIGDMQDEYVEALAQGHHWHARWIHLRGVLSFWQAALVMVPESIVRTVVAAVWKSAG